MSQRDPISTPEPISTVRPAVVATIVVAVISLTGIVVADRTQAREPAAAQTTAGALPGDAGCILQGAPGRLIAPQGSQVTNLDGTVVATPDQVGAIAGPIRVRVLDGTLTEAPLIEVGSRAGQAWIECGSPVTGTFLQIPDVGSAEVILTNVDSTDAVVNLTMYGRDGEVVDSGARGIAVPRRSSTVVPLAALAPAGTPLGLKVQTSQGRVLAAARLTATGGGLDQAGGLVPGSRQVVAGIPASSSSVRLILTNPTDEAITARPRLLGVRGAFAPAGNESVEVAPLSSVMVDLSDAIRGDQVAIEVTADRGELAASAQVGRQGDALLIPAATPGDNLVGTGPEGALQVVNPSAQPIQVQVGPAANPSQVTIPAGAIWTGNATAGLQEVRGTGVMGAVTSPTGGAARRLHPLQSVDIAGPVQVDPTLR